MTKTRTLLAMVFILGLFAVAPRASAMMAANCFQSYWQNLDSCSNLGGYIARDMCGLDAGIELAGCVRRTVIGV